MISVFNFDFYSDGYALNPSIIAPATITDTTLTNGIFDHWNVSNNDSISWIPASRSFGAASTSASPRAITSLIAASTNAGITVVNN